MASAAGSGLECCATAQGTSARGLRSSRGVPRRRGSRPAYASRGGALRGAGSPQKLRKSGWDRRPNRRTRLFPFATARVIRGGPNKGSKQMPLYSAIRADCALVGRSPTGPRGAPVRKRRQGPSRGQGTRPTQLRGGIWLSQGDTLGSIGG
jgi:hypothetical protein